MRSPSLNSPSPRLRSRAPGRLVLLALAGIFGFAVGSAAPVRADGPAIAGVGSDGVLERPDRVGGMLDPNDPEPEAPGAPPPRSPLPLLLQVGSMLGLYWLFILRPQRTKDQAEKTRLATLKKDDLVVTKDGIIGTVTSINGDQVTILVDEQQNAKLRYHKEAVAEVLPASAASPPGDAAGKT